MTNWDNIVSDKDLEKAAKLRKNTYYEKKDYTSAKDDLFEDGWEAISQYTNPKHTKYRKEKPYDEQFEDSVWTMFKKMGFTHLNKDRSFKMSYDFHNPALTQQIDIFAVEEETIFIVECKTVEKTKEVQFKKELEALKGMKEGLMKEARKQFPNKKVIFVWATKDIIIGAKDKERMAEWQIVHFDDSTIQYYNDLANHLGTSARYQLLGNILKGQEIRNMKMDVPAIEGKMGNNLYYAFSIEPIKLLKIGYVLHRTKANADMMPTYQRVIKKSRLTEIRKYVNNGGFFPNSIIISIDTKGNKLNFDPAGGAMKLEDTRSRIGILHLPKQYHSAYIIDGQHRLYGYSDTKYAETDCIPVVAFVNLDRGEQLKMFMDINENQKAVPKMLRVTLNKDMFWDSNNYNERRTALRSKIAQSLGEDSSSPLLNRVVLSEDTKETDYRCISLEAIQNALSKSDFFNVYNKDNSVKKNGTFDFGDIDKTSDIFFKFLAEVLKLFMVGCNNQWEKGKPGLLTHNRGLHGCIRVIDDIVTHLLSQKKIDPLTDSIDKLVSEVEFYLTPLFDFINGCTEVQEKEIRSTFGTNGDTKFHMYFAKPISDAYIDFNPEGLTEFFENQTKKYNETSRSYLVDISNRLRYIVREELENRYGTSWQKDGVPKDILKRIHNEAYDKNLEADDEHQIDDWDCITMKDCADIAVYTSNWSTIFEHILVRPEDKDSKGNKETKLAWINAIATEYEKITKNASYSVEKKNFDLIESVYDWLCVKE